MFKGYFNVKIDFANLQYQYQLYKDEIDQAIHNVLDKSNYIMGEEISTLEHSLEVFTDASHAITCASGTDALLLAMMALDIQPGDEIITTPFTFISTAETISFLGAIPVFVDIDEQTYNIDPSKIEAAITDKTKAIIPVSLFGQPSDIDAIQAVIDKRQKTKNQKRSGLPEKLHLIIDGAQSFGSTYKGKMDSNLGDISITSFFPAKPLGCFGDGGAIFTNNEKLATKIRSLRVHGQSKRYHHQYIGLGARMDTIQAAILNVKLKYYKKDLALRQEVAEKYNKVFSQQFLVSSKGQEEKLKIPFIKDTCTSSWAQYSVRVKGEGRRVKVQEKLKENGVPTAVHYPIPLHLQECFQYLGYKKGSFPISEMVSEEIISLPMNPYLKDDEISYIVNALLSENA